MGKPYSDDLRERVVAAIEAGHTRVKVAQLYNMALSTVGGIIKRKRETGSVSPDKFGGYKTFTLEPHKDRVKELVAEQPDSTLAELQVRLAKEKVKVSQSGISRFLRHINLTFKKSLHAAEQDRPDVAAARKALRKEQKILDPKQLVFIDETAATTKMTRLYGRAPQGKRLVDKVPHGHWKTTTFICGLRYDGVTAPFMLDGPMNGPHFLAYVEQILAPNFEEGTDRLSGQCFHSQGRRCRRSNRGERRMRRFPAGLQSGSKSHRTTLRKAQIVLTQNEGAHC